MLILAALVIVVACRTTVAVRQIGAFKLDSVTSDAAVIGQFINYGTGGSIGTGVPTMVRPILVK